MRAFNRFHRFVETVELDVYWPNFGLWGATVPKRSNILDTCQRQGMPDVCPPKIWYSSVPRHFWENLCRENVFGPHAKSTSDWILGWTSNNDSGVSHSLPLIFRGGVKKVRKFTKLSITQSQIDRFRSNLVRSLPTYTTRVRVQGQVVKGKGHSLT